MSVPVQQSERELISVIIPLHNARPYIEQAIESVLNQTEHRLHLYVIDDHSTDGSADVVKEYQERFSHRVTYQRLDQAAGRPVIGKNVGVRISKGEYIAFLDHDDWWELDHLEQLLKVMESDPAIGLVGSDVNFYDQGRKTVTGQFWGGQSWTPEEINRKILVDSFYATSSCTLFRRAVFDRIGLLDEDLWLSDDREIAMRVVVEHHFKAAAVSKATIGRRWHQASLSNLGQSVQKILEDYDTIERKLNANYQLTTDEKELIHRCRQIVRRRLANSLLSAGDYKQARNIYRTLEAQGKFALPLAIIRVLLVIWPAAAVRLVRAKKQHSFDRPAMSQG